MAFTTSFRFASFALLAGLIAAPAAYAQSAPPTVQLVQAEQQSAQPDEEQLDSFVTATVSIITIQHQAQQEMAATEEPAQQEQVRNQALQMIVAAVEAEGLTVDEYNGIVQQVEADPELGETVQQRIQEQIGN